MLFCFPEKGSKTCMHALSHGTRQSVIVLLFLLRTALFSLLGSAIVVLLEE